MVAIYYSNVTETLIALGLNVVLQQLLTELSTVFVDNLKSPLGLMWLSVTVEPLGELRWLT